MNHNLRRRVERLERESGFDGRRLPCPGFPDGATSSEIDAVLRAVDGLTRGLPCDDGVMTCAR